MKVNEISKSRILQLCLVTVGVVVVGGVAGLLGQYRVFTSMIALAIAALVVLIGAIHRYLVQTRKAINEQFGKNRKELGSLREDLELSEFQNLSVPGNPNASRKENPKQTITREVLPASGLIGSGFVRPDDEEAALLSDIRKNPDLFTKFALRTRSEVCREFFARAATGMAYGYNEVVEAFSLLRAGDEREAVAIRNWHKATLLGLGRILANQRRCEADLDAARKILLGLHWVFGEKTLKDNDLKLLVEVAQEQGDNEAALAILEKSGVKSKDPSYFSLVKANSLTPDSAEWMECVNDVFGNYGLERIAAYGHGSVTLDSIKTEVTPRTVAGPLVSVIIPTYEGADRIETALKSLSAQTWSNIEVIVVDDGSSSKNNELLRHICSQYPEVELIELEANKGAYIARNAGLKQANGQFITVHDDDDWSHARKIQTQVEHLLAHADIVANTTGHVRTTTDLRFVRINSTPTLIQNNFSSLMFRKEVFDQVGHWDDVNRGGDEEFKNRVIAATGSKIPQVGSAPFSFTRTRETSLTAGEIDRGYQDPARLFYHSAFSRMHTAQTLDGTARDARPANMEPGMRRANLGHFDVIFVADFMSPASAASLREARALSRVGYRVGIAHLYSVAGVGERRFQEASLDAVRAGDLSFVTLNDRLSVSRVICRELSTFSFAENLHTEWTVGSVVFTSAEEQNLALAQLSELGRRNIQQVFGQNSDTHRISVDAWPALLAHSSYETQNRDNGVPVVGRSRDPHSSHWPNLLLDIELIYTSNETYEVLLVDDFEGLSSKAQNLLKKNATLIVPGEFSEAEYFASVDFWVELGSSLPTSEPTRDILTAMASGVPVVLPPEQESVYGDAAIYCAPKNVRNVVSRAWKNSDFYRQQMEAGLTFASNFLNEADFVERVKALGAVPPVPSGVLGEKVAERKQSEIGELKSLDHAAKEVE